VDGEPDKGYANDEEADGEESYELETPRVISLGISKNK
jgi:hypothetical protein